MIKNKNNFFKEMKKYFLLFLFSILLLSCSKGGKVTINGKVTNGSPLERLEIIDASGIATLPLANFGVDAKGNFSETIEIPRDGVYVITYAGNTGFLYLKGGDKVNLDFEAMLFPQGMKITGDAKGNTEYLMESQQFINQYMSKLDQSVISKKEEDFLKELEKYKGDITKKMDEIAKVKKPDSDVEKFNKRELDVTLLMISSQYESMHGPATNDPKYKAGAKLLDFQKGLENESYVEDMPNYRNYVISKLSAGFQKFFEGQKNAAPTSNVQMFSKFLDTQKDVSDKTKEYLLAAVAAQYDLREPANPKLQEVFKFLDTKIKNSAIKSELKNLEEAIYGIEQGTDVSGLSLVKQDGSKITLADLKGKPTALVFYASWNPYITESTMPVLKEMVKFYGSKMNFTFINLDDTQDQFVKTSKAMFTGIQGNNYYATGGMKSEIAKKFAVYGFKMPSFIIIDKDGKISSKTYLNIADPALVDALNKASGLQAPTGIPQTPEMMAPPTEHSANDGHGH